MEKFQQQAIELLMNYGPKVLGAILVLLVGLQIISWFNKWFRKTLEKRNIDKSLQPFLKSLLSITLKILLLVSVMGMVGIQMTSFIAILGAAGLAIGLALSGTLQNFAGGVLLMIFKPFKVGDYITAQGYSGTVSEIQIFLTILKTPDNVTIFIPNGDLATQSLTNYSTQHQRRVDWNFGIAYGDDFDHAKKVLQQLIAEDKRILDNPQPFIVLGELADSSVNITVRVWVNASDYWSVFFDMNEKVYKTFAKEGINIPFPQLDVHLPEKNA
ncbi:MAG: mechanosensitive ion channel family protein [Bacteroidota bacterium]